MNKKITITLTILMLTITIFTNAVGTVPMDTHRPVHAGFLNNNSILNTLFNKLFRFVQSIDISGFLNQFFSENKEEKHENPRPTVQPTEDLIAQLTIDKDDNVNENQWVYPGETINYTITFSNSDCCVAQNVIVKDYLPDDVTITEASHSYTMNDNILIWNVGSLDPNEQQERWILIQLSNSINPGEQLTNMVKIFLDDEEHDTAATHTTIGSPLVHIQKSDGINTTDYINPTDTITYNITYENPTGFTYTDVIIRDVLPENVTFVNSSHPCNNPNGFVHWNIETIEPYETETILLNISIDTDAPTGEQITNIVFLNYTLGSTQGSVHTTETTLVGEPTYQPLEINKEDHCANDAIPPEGMINYTIVIHNPNLVSVHHVWVTDYLPDDVLFLDASSSHFVDYYEHIADWYYAHLGPNETKTMWLKVQAKDTLNPGDSITNTVSVDSEETSETTTSETTLINEIFPPETILTVKDPHVDSVWVTTDTPIVLHATDDANEDQSGISYIYYRIEWNDAVFEYQIMDNSEGDTNKTSGIVETSITFNESCTHHLTYYAVDKTGTVEQPHSKMFYVDETPPGLDSFYSGFSDPYFYKQAGTWYTGIGRSTLVNLMATGSGSNHDRGCNGGVGFDHLGYRWYAGDEMDDLEKIVDTTSSNPIVSIDLLHSLWHRVEYWTEDQLGNRNPNTGSHQSIDLLIDDVGPETTSYYEGPFFEDEDGIDWITSHTKKIVEATDSGGIPKGSGAYKIQWHIDKKMRGEWSTVQQGTVFDNDLNDTDGTPARPENGDIGGLYGFDYKNEPFIFQDLNANWSYDPGEPVLDYDPDHDGFIEKYIAEPGEFYPDIIDQGGLWAMDTDNEPYIFQDRNQSWHFDENDTVIHIDPDEDAMIDEEWIPKYAASPQYGDKGGLYAVDSKNETYVFQDTSEKSPWTFDKWWDSATNTWMHEPLVTLKPDYDGAGTIQMNMSIPEDGEHRFYYQAFDRFGNPGIEHNQYVRVDNTPPDSWIETAEPHCGWPTICVTTESRITLHTEDEMIPCNVGIDNLHYIISENDMILEEREIPQKEYYFYFDTFGEGVYNVTWFATDLLGNTEPIHYQHYCVDNTPPSVTIDIGEPRTEGIDHEPDYWITKDTKVSVKVSQTGCCSLLTTRFRLNKGSWHILNDTEATQSEGVQIPTRFFETEQRYEIEIEASNCYLPAVITRKVVYVDNSPPDITIMNPIEGGYYGDGDIIKTTVFAEDHPLHPLHAEPVGISQGNTGNAVLIDIYPDFTMLPLMNLDFMFDPEKEGSPFYQGDFKIIGSEDELNDGPVLFVVEVEDDLGNSVNSILDVLYDYYEQADGDEEFFKSLINNDEGINKKVVWLNIDQDDSEDDDDETPTGTVESVSFLSPAEGIVDDETIDIRLETTGDAEPNDVTVEVSISVEGYHEFTEIAEFDDEYQVLEFDISFLENNSVLSFHATATDDQGTVVETSDDLSVIINNTVYFSEYLVTGWNTIQFDEIKNNNDVETVFASILDTNDVTVIFEEETGDYYIPGQTFNLLNTVDIDHTYKIKMKDDKPLYLNEQR